MPTSINGWQVIESASDQRLKYGVIPGTNIKIRLHKEALPLLLAVAAEVNKRVLPLSVGNNSPAGQDEGGWVYRKVAGSTKWSNHASGSAADLNWRSFPMFRRTMSAKQRAACIAIAKEFGDIITWGGVWQNGVDEMHWEVSAGKTVDDVRAACKRLGIRADGTRKPVKYPDYPGKPLVIGSRGAAVRAVQEVVRVTVDGIYGEKTSKAVAAFQKPRPALWSEKRGTVGEKTYEALIKRLG